MIVEFLPQAKAELMDAVDYYHAEHPAKMSAEKASKSFSIACSQEPKKGCGRSGKVPSKCEGVSSAPS
jgi:hypothetical protein